MKTLLISDIHANLTALEAVLADAGNFDAVWCLGDLVGYGPDPNECIERVAALPNLRCVMGNHDAAALRQHRGRRLQPRGARGARVDPAAPVSGQRRPSCESLPEMIERSTRSPWRTAARASRYGNTCWTRAPPPSISSTSTPCTASSGTPTCR